MHPEAQAVRIFVARNSIAIKVSDSVFQIPKQEFYRALQECERALEEGVQLASLPIPSTEERLRLPKPGARRVVRVVNSYASRGVKVYLSADEARWLGIAHGSPVEIIPTTINGENALIIKPASQPTQRTLHKSKAKKIRRRWRSDTRDARNAAATT